MERLSRIEIALTSILVLSVACFFIFYRLDANPIFMWDEARLAVNALEMCQTKHWLVTTFNYTPDMWNVKPPLMIMLQALCMKVLGYNELAVRLPSAIAALATVILLYVFAIRQLKSLWIAASCVLFLCTSAGYICVHVTRTGDFDSLLIFFLTAYFLSAFAFIKTRQYGYYILVGILLCFALFTKGVAGVFFLPGTILMLFMELRWNIFRPKYVLPILLPFLCIGIFYFVREHYNPGYIHTVFFEEVQGRMFSERFNTGSPWYYFFERMVNVHFSPWWMLALLSLPIYFLCETTERKLIAGIWLTLFIFWIPITIAVNKNEWYSAPSFPLMALLAGITFGKVADYFTQDRKHYMACISVLVIMLYLPFFHMLNSVFAKSPNIGLAELIKSDRISTNTKFISNKLDQSLIFYQKALNAKAIQVQIENSDKIIAGDKVVTMNTKDADSLKQKFDCREIYVLDETRMMYVQKADTPTVSE